MADGKWPMAGGNPARGVPGFCAFRLFAISYTLSALLVFSTRCRDGRGSSAEPGKRRSHHEARRPVRPWGDRKSTRLNSSHRTISYAVFCLKKKNIKQTDY